MKLFPKQREAAALIADGANSAAVFIHWSRLSGKSVTLRAARLLIAVRRGRDDRRRPLDH